MQSEEPYLVVVFGLPASGKSTASEFINKNVLPEAILISVDKIESILMSTPLQMPSSGAPIGQLLQFFKQISAHKFSKVAFDPSIWKQSRKYIIECIDRLAEHGPIILEDDLLYRSQRKPYRKLSWEKQIKYIEIFMNCSVEKCKQNLALRKMHCQQSDITDEVITKAAQKLQVGMDNPHIMAIDSYQLQQLTRDKLVKLMKPVVIQPNDPNDPALLPPHPPAHLPKTQQIIEAQTRKYVGTLMKMSQQQIEERFGSSNLAANAIHNKKDLGNFCAKWKKNYVKSAHRTSNAEDMEIDFLNTLCNR